MKNYVYQDEAIKRFTNKEFFGLIFDCGMGKTNPLIDIAVKKDKVNIVIAPQTIGKQWKEKIEERTGDKQDIFILNSSTLRTKKGQKAFQEFLER